eukprot:7504026-Pyramimonas_sp.AAC.1
MAGHLCCRDFALLTQEMKFAKQQSMIMERKARVSEAKAHALDNRIPLHWFKLAHKLAVRLALHTLDCYYDEGKDCLLIRSKGRAECKVSGGGCEQGRSIGVTLVHDGTYGIETCFNKPPKHRGPKAHTDKPNPFYKTLSFANPIFCKTIEARTSRRIRLVSTTAFAPLERKLRRQMYNKVNYARTQQGKLQKQLADSIKSREQAANKARNKVTHKDGYARTPMFYTDVTLRHRKRTRNSRLSNRQRGPPARDWFPLW